MVHRPSFWIVALFLGAQPLLAQDPPKAAADPGAQPPAAAPETSSPASDADLSGSSLPMPAEAEGWARIGFSLGVAAINGSLLRDVLLSGDLGEQALYVDVQHGAFGLRLEINTQEGTTRYAHIDSDYQAFSLRAGSTYLLWPADSRVNLMVFGGGFLAWHGISLADGMQKWEDSSFGPGAFFGVEAPVRIVGKFYLSLRANLSYQHINFSRFNSNHNLIERTLLVGGGCAF